MFVRLTPAQATGIHGWGWKLKTTLSWRDVEENERIDFDLLLQMELRPKDLKRLMPDVRMWVLHAGCLPHHALSLVEWPAHPFNDLHGDLADVIALKATSRQLRSMRVTYADLRSAGMTPETMRLMDFPFDGWIELGMTPIDVAAFSDAQLGRVFQMTRVAVLACFRES